MTVNKELLEALKEAKNGLEWYHANHPESVDGSDDEAMERIDAAIAKAEAERVEPVQINGPWNAVLLNDGVYIECDDFAHDAVLKVTGDFESADQKYLYACGVARHLNASPPAAAVSEPLTDEQIEKLRGPFPKYLSEWDEDDLHDFARAIEAAIRSK